MSLFENLYRTLHEQNRPLMNFVLRQSQYKHECDLEQQQREESQSYASAKTPDRHSDNSLLGSVRRRLIAPKLRVQNTHADNGKPAIVASTPTSSTDPRSKTRSMTMDLRRSASRESINTNGHSTTTTTSTAPTNGNGRMTSFFSSSKVLLLPICQRSKPWLNQFLSFDWLEQQSTLR